MNYLVATLVLLLSSFRTDDPVGIRFFTGSWTDVLSEAKRQNKPVFVDFHASWCPPCRRMAREAFPNVDVGAAYNDRFINYQIDGETGEGPAIAQQYGVSSYPTTLYLTPDGEIIHRGVGYGGVNALIQQADRVLRTPKLRRAIASRRRMGLAP